LWLFDANTRALEATVVTCPGEYLCTASLPGFVLPSQCLDDNFTDLCTTDQSDASVDTGVVDALGN
jgi:hypothetical protein